MKHPVQPFGNDGTGVIRFKENKIVSYLCDGKLNDLARMPFSDEDWCQLMQLIGYSLSGYGDLSRVSDEEFSRAVYVAEQQPEAKS